MRILIDCSHIATGGAIQNSIAVLDNARATVDHEWHVIMTSVLSRQVPRAHDSLFGTACRLDNWSSFRTRYSVHLSMPRWERAIRPEVCFAPGGPVYWRARCRQVVAFALPHLIYPEQDVIRATSGMQRLRLELMLGAARRSFLRADTLVVQTGTVRDRLVRVLGVPEKRVVIIGNSYSPAFAASVAELRRGVRSDRFVVLVPSAYYVHKNLEFVVDVAHEIHRAGLRDVEFRFTLPNASRAWQRLRDLAAARGVISMIRTLGSVPHRDLAASYCAADLVFLPTLLECSTAVYPEAFLAGVPVVTSALDFAVDLCGEGARYVNPRDAGDAASAIMQLERDGAHRRDLIAAGKRALQTRYLTPQQKWRAQLSAMLGES
jgi:glycosyltransferase involved in cell wall biosynthesis